MRGTELEEAAPGRLVPYDKRSYYKPDPLPPSESIDLGDDGTELLSEATFWLGKLSGLCLTVEFPPVLYTSLLRKEAMESAAIEGADVDFNALYSAESGGLEHGERESGSHSGDRPSSTKDTTEVLNYEDALSRGIDAIDEGDDITIELLHELHDVLMTGVPDDRIDTDTIGEFKQMPNYVGDFLPPVPGAVDGLMDALVTYVRTGGSYHPLIDVALVHYQFETIHPYGDGNGRLGRLLVTLQLYDHGYLERPTLYLSEYFNRNKQTYVDRLEGVRRSGEWEEWCTFFVRGVRTQARESVERSLELRTLRERYDDRYGGTEYAYARLGQRLFEQPYFTASEVAKMLDVEPTTAYRAIERLRDDGVLEEVTGQERNREFRATEIFEILERPPKTY